VNPILAITERANELRAAGVDVISLAAGEPDTPTADHIVEAALRAAHEPRHHRYGSARGLPELRRAIIERLPGGDGEVLVTLGAKHALFLALHAIVDGGDVLVPTPGWPGHRAAVEAAGRRARAVLGDTDFRVTAETLDAAWTPDTRALVIANPGNPTGAAYDRSHWETIAAWVADRDVWLITDDVYSAFVYEHDHVHALEVAPELRDRCIIVDSVSKAHSMTGWRVGWLAGPPGVVDHATRMLSSTITHVPAMSQHAAHEALTNGAPRVHVYRDRRDRAHRALSAIDGVDCPLPDGGMFLFPSVPHATDLAARLLDEAHLAVVPGEAFGAPDRLRICFAVEALDEALRRLTDAI
jgi:aspartate aminotransferase